MLDRRNGLMPHKENMDSATINAFAGGAIGVLGFWIAYLVIRFFWRLLVGAVHRLPDGIEETAKFAGKVSAKAEESANKAILAFKEGRKGK